MLRQISYSRPMHISEVEMDVIKLSKNREGAFFRVLKQMERKAMSQRLNVDFLALILLIVLPKAWQQTGKVQKQCQHVTTQSLESVLTVCELKVRKVEQLIMQLQSKTLARTMKLNSLGSKIIWVRSRFPQMNAIQQILNKKLCWIQLYPQSLAGWNPYSCDLPDIRQIDMHFRQQLFMLQFFKFFMQLSRLFQRCVDLDYGK
eukprot:TRINITY_DN31582_c0_g1_i2.p1 TRINITY_DN31582_c0_g1~~TRINITY_DN31582_c0_g1_i2.p1  ORF type:complete len:203 (-),score=-3.14 TRINITY_DN31582_c0_g1_i2:134-742(-)